MSGTTEISIISEENGSGEIRGWHQGTGAAIVHQALTISSGNLFQCGATRTLKKVGDVGWYTAVGES